MGALGEIEIREVRPEEYQDTSGLTQRAYAEYARPGDPLREDYCGVLADVAGRAGFATALVAVAGRCIAGTATVELDPTIGGIGPRHLSRSPAGPGRRSARRTPPSRWWPRSVGTGRWASAAICLATSSCTPIRCSRPSGFRCGHRADKAPGTPAIYDPKRRAAIRTAAGPLKLMA